MINLVIKELEGKGIVNFDTDEIKTQDVNTVNVLIRFESEPLQTLC